MPNTKIGFLLWIIRKKKITLNLTEDRRYRIVQKENRTKKKKKKNRL